MERQQDIHLNDKSEYNDIQRLWQSEDYANAISVINSSQFQTKRLTEELFMSLHTVLTQLQNNSDAEFKNDKIKIYDTIPSDIPVGTVFGLKL